MIEFQDLEVPGGFVIPAHEIRQQIAWSQRNRHAACYQQRVDVSLKDGTYVPIIAVVDLFDERVPTLSVTNDAEYVVRLAVNAIGDFPILYRDTEGQWDELCHKGIYFTHFRPLASKDFEEAADKLLVLHELDSTPQGLVN